MLQVEKGVPIPPESRNRYPWQDMAIGDSFMVAKSERNKVACAASVYGSRNGKKFSYRQTDDGVRVWRTK